VFDPADYDLSNAQPLRIGFGQTDYFAGQISDVRLYKSALSAEEVEHIFSERAHGE
jgi:hypothetical protein